MEEKIVDSQYQTKGYLCYLGILVLIPLLTVKKEVRDEFIDCHIKQGFGLFVSMVIFSVLRSFGGNILGMIFGLLSLVCFVLAILGLINVSKKKVTKLPVLGDIFDKINI
ncbi:MAG: hypothetical protein II937_02410 [Bacteroidales bacterium]|nr:hypothetical protein [Bacteroidales bacterium]MBQ5402775.1 hypothetical protein [Bacteroidales bacterium]